MKRLLINNLIIPLLDLDNKYKRILLLTIDVIILTLVILFTFWIYSERELYQLFRSDIFWIIPSTLFFGIIIFLITGQYRGITKYINSESFYYIILRNSFLLIAIILFGSLLNLTLLKFKNWLIFWIILNIFSILIRVILRDIIIIFSNFQTKNINKVIIYGAGEAGAQLAASMRFIPKWKIIGFVDDNPELWGRCVQNKLIYSPKFLRKFKNDIDLVCLAIPSLLTKRKLEIVNQIKKENINVLQVPSLTEIMSGKSLINQLIPLNIEDLLRRDQVEPNINLLQSAVKNKVICITGGAGSIGSEIFFQIIKYHPKKIIIIDNSEINVYDLSQKLKDKNIHQDIIKIVLGDISRFSFVSNIFNKDNVDIVFHAAAYKHVPLVENNPISGIINNVLATKIICDASIKNSIKNVVLISTDKAVRPANVMGASKRLSELIFQAYSLNQISEKLDKNKVCFSIVRFGNVLNSSGSVVPLFKKQILEGGPITITHKDIIRYFMSIEEAAQLVIQTVSLANNGDIFLLDMGKPKKIQDLAKQMINLYGLELKDKDNPNGDIEIIFSGLRPGEKLYEELLIDGRSVPTKHPLIFRANERVLLKKDLLNKIDLLSQKCLKMDEKGALKILQDLVDEWHRQKFSEINN